MALLPAYPSSASELEIPCPRANPRNKQAIAGAVQLSPLCFSATMAWIIGANDKHTSAPLKENAWPRALWRLRDNPALSGCAFKEHESQWMYFYSWDGQQGGEEEFAWKEWALVSESASSKATLGESEPTGEHAGPGRYRSTGVSPPCFHLCCRVKGTHKLYTEIDQLMSLFGTTEWELWGFSQGPRAVALRLGNLNPVDILAPLRRMLSCF